MKTVNSALSTALREGYSLKAQPRLIAEWNMNRYYKTTVDNMPSEDTNAFDDEFFPIESIVEGNRPTKGIIKARINEGTAGAGYEKDAPRYYIGSEDDHYKYWTSPSPTGSAGNFTTVNDGTWGDVTVVRPHVIYKQNVSVNKIVVKVENTWASPKQFFIKVASVNPTTAAHWITVSTSPTIANDGTITLWWNGSTWSANKPQSFVDPPLTSIRGVMVMVNSMTAGRDRSGNITSYRQRGSGLVATDGARSSFNLIEISARREVDLSNRLISVDDTQDISDVSELYPIGTLTTNEGRITLSNIYQEGSSLKNGYFSPNNPNSPFVGILEENVKFNLEYIYTINESTYTVQQFSMYGGTWGGLVSDEVTVEVKDYSKFFDDINPRPQMHENLTVPEIIQRLLDSIGFVDWKLDADDLAVKHIVPHWWSTDEKTVWETLDDLAKGTQTAIYFDAFGVLQIKTREEAFKDAATPVWTLRAENLGKELADIINLSQGEDLTVNHVTVTYKNTKWDKEVNGIAAMQKVWEPEAEIVAVRASTLMADINADSTHVWIPQDDVRLWPYTGMFEIQGEIFEYEGKQFIYYTYTKNVASSGAVTYTNPVRNSRNVKSNDEMSEYNKKTPHEYRHRNGLTGALKLKVVDGSTSASRGMWNSETRNHTVDLSGWNCARIDVNAAGTMAMVENTGAQGMKHQKAESSLHLSQRPNSGPHDMTYAYRGTVGSDPYQMFGTQIKFDRQDNLTTQSAGMVLNNAETTRGYYIELTASSRLSNKERSSRNELMIYTVENGKKKPLTGKGSVATIATGIQYDLDAQITTENGNHRLIVWLNGTMMENIVISGSDRVAMSGRFALYVRGSTKAGFQYFYAIRRGIIDPDDDASFFNLKAGGYTGGFWDREWVWGWKQKSRRRKRKKSTKNREPWKIAFFDEFGPIVHEIREFKVAFDPAPVLHSRLYMSNEWTAVNTEYRSDPFGATFVIVNAARENAILKGEDSLMFGAGVGSRTINQILTVIGRILVIAEGETVESKDEDSIKVRGKIEATLESDWIQSEAMAKDIADWMKKHWSVGLDVLDVEVFGNPLFEIGDVVRVDYPEKHILAGTHKYFVTKIETGWDNGINTKLALRRVR